MPFANHLFFGLFGSNDRAGIECINGSKDLACSDGTRVRPNGAVEIVNLGVDPPQSVLAVDLGVCSPTALAVSPDGNQFYVVDALNRNVYTILSANGAFVNTVYIPEGPVDAVLSADGRYLYVTTLVPSVVAVDTLWGVVVGQAIPGQTYPEWFGGIAISNAPGGDYLAVAATSGPPAPAMMFLEQGAAAAMAVPEQYPALYFLTVHNGNMSITSRIAISGFCQDSMCPSGDDTVFTENPTALLNNLRCAEMYNVDRPFAVQDKNATVVYDNYACPPLNPHNSTLYSRALRKAYTVFRGPVNSEPPAMSILDPATKESWFISEFVGIPEAAAFAPDAVSLFVVKQETWTSPLKLDLFDARNEIYTPDIYTFSNLVQRRTAIDAKVIVKTGGYIAGGQPLLGPVRSKTLFGHLAQIALIGFGIALWRRDRRKEDDPQV